VFAAAAERTDDEEGEVERVDTVSLACVLCVDEKTRITKGMANQDRFYNLSCLRFSSCLFFIAYSVHGRSAVKVIASISLPAPFAASFSLLLFARLYCTVLRDPSLFLSLPPIYSQRLLSSFQSDDSPIWQRRSFFVCLLIVCVRACACPGRDRF